MLAGRHCRMERLPITSCRKGWNNKLVPLSDLNVFSYLTNDVGRALFSHHVKIHLLLSISNRVSMHSLRVHDWVNFHTQLALYIIIWNLYLVLDPFLVLNFYLVLVLTHVHVLDFESHAQGVGPKMETVFTCPLNRTSRIKSLQGMLKACYTLWSNLFQIGLGYSCASTYIHYINLETTFVTLRPWIQSVSM